MRRARTILPGTGRGTMRSMVEGTRLNLGAGGESPPSRASGARHLPVPGRIL